LEEWFSKFHNLITDLLYRSCYKRYYSLFQTKSLYYSSILDMICIFIIHSRALNQSVIVERVTRRSNILWYILDRNLLHSCKSWLFSRFFNPFQMFCQFQTYDKRYGRVMKRIWDINTVFFYQFCLKLQKRGKICLREIHFFATASTLVILFFSLKLAQISFKHTWNWVYLRTHIFVKTCLLTFWIVLFGHGL
jgi:hypothetical protein